MNTTKLVDALDDLRAKRNDIDAAIVALESAVAVLNGHQESGNGVVKAQADSATQMRRKPRGGFSNLDIAAEVISRKGPEHISELAVEVSNVAGHLVSRATLDGGISREIRENGASSRFVRLAPAMYDVRKDLPHGAPQE